MNLSKLIAKIMSLIHLSACLGAFFSADYYSTITADLFRNAYLVYLTGFITVILGLLIVNYHNRWVKNWTVVITMVGWIALLKGIVLIACPRSSHSLFERMLTGWRLEFFPYAALFLGLLFAYFGFVSKDAPAEKSAL